MAAPFECCNKTTTGPSAISQASSATRAWASTSKRIVSTYNVARFRIQAGHDCLAVYRPIPLFRARSPLSRANRPFSFFRHLIFACLCCAPWQAQAAGAFDVIAQAVETDPRVLAAQAVYRAKLAELDIARAAYLPVIKGTGSVGAVESQDPLSRDGTKKIVGLEVAQAIPVFQHESTRLALARAAAGVEEAEVRRVRQSVLAEIVETVLNVQAARETLALRTLLLINLREQFAAAREAVACGGLRLTEEKLVRSRLAQTEALWERAASDLGNGLWSLHQRLALTDADRPPEIVVDEAGIHRWWSTTLSLDALEQAAKQAAPALLKAQAEVESAQAEQAIARSDRLPSLSVSLQGQRGTFGTASADSQSAFLGLNVPLYDGGAGSSRIDSASQRLQAAREKAAQEARQTRQRLADAWNRWKSSVTLTQAWRLSEQEEATTVQLSEEQLAGGVNTEIGVLRVRQSWLETRLQGVDYRTQKQIAWVRLMQEAGALPTLAPAAEK